MQRRLELACALVHSPALLFLGIIALVTLIGAWILLRRGMTRA